MLFSFFLLIQIFNARHLKATLSFTLFFLISSLIININQIKNREIIVYNSSPNLTMQLICGKKNYIISDHKFEENENTINLIKRTNQKLKLTPPIYLTKNDSLIDSFLFSKNGLIVFEGKKILFQNNIPNLPKTISPDFIINPKPFNKLENSISKNTIIITNKRFFQEENPVFNRVHQTSKQGAFIEKW